MRTIKQFLRQRYLIGGIELPAYDKNALTATEIDFTLIQMLEPAMLVAICEEEKESLHLHASAINQKFLQAMGAEIGKPLEEFIDLMETLAFRQFVEQLQNRPLRRGKRQRPVFPLDVGRASRHRLVAEQCAILAKSERDRERQFHQPAWGLFVAVKKNFFVVLRQIMSEALKLQCRPAPYHW